MKLILPCWLILILMASAIASQAQEPLVIYDDFEREFLYAPSWFGSDGFDPGMKILESVREIAVEPIHTGLRFGSSRGRIPIYENRSLRLAKRAFGNRESDIGVSYAWTRLHFVNPDQVMSMAATVKVESANARGCVSNSAATQARARISGFFFNTGTPTPGSAVNDVMAYIAVRRRSNSSDPPDVLEVYGLVFHCQDEECRSSTTLDFVDLGTVRIGQKVALRITWDPNSDQFIFQKGGDLVVYSPYTVSDASLSSIQNKRLEIHHSIPNCTADPRPAAYMEAFFDDVFVNASAAP